MPDASFVQSSFLGGEWSKRAQGRFDRPDYRSAMNVCLNGLPIETGAWTRRPGTRHVLPTRGGAFGRLIKFDFQRTDPYNMEFTASWLRFFNGASIVTTNDDQTVTAISGANPAKVTTSTAHGWATDDQVIFPTLGTKDALLYNRTFAITVTSSTQFTLADAITGTALDGATLVTFVSATVARIRQIASPYGVAAIPGLRAVQATKSALLLEGSTKPYLLAVTAAPSGSTFATFSLNEASFIDGPYLDPVAGGAQVTPSALSGNVTLTITFPTYDSAKAYSKGDYVTYSSVKYQSLIDANLNNQPDTHATSWTPVSGGAAVSANGFVATDIGRSIRLFSEPDLWATGSTYAAGDFVTYNSVYYRSVVGSNTGSIPGRDVAKWLVASTDQVAVWTWGKITAISNAISGATGTNFDFTPNTILRLSAAFDGTATKTAANSTVFSGNVSTNTMDCALGKNYTSSTKTISFAVVSPCSDIDFVHLNSGNGSITSTITWNLRAKQTAPASASDGTLLGTTGSVANSRQAVTIQSNDQATAWNYVWVEASIVANDSPFTSNFIFLDISQVAFYSAQGTSTAITVQILGDNLLYTTPVRVWRMGAYSDTTGWPRCGCFHEGRIWLSGAIANRIDSCVEFGQSTLFPEKINFAPTDKTGAVADSNAITYSFNSKDENVINWMEPDQQGIICGTQAGEWLVQASATNAPLTPTSIQAHRVTKIGCANVEPRRTEHTIVFVQNYGRKIMEYFADVFSGKFSAPNLSERAKHLTQPGISEIAYQQELAPIIWMRLADGGLIGTTYKRETLASSQGPTFNGHHRHTLGSGREVESICVGPNDHGSLDSLAMITNDTSSNIRHVELMTDLFDEDADAVDAWFLDNAITPAFSQNVTVAGIACLQLGGLWHLNGSTVSAFIGGLDCGDYTVASGVINVPYDTANTAFTSTFVSGYSGTLPIVVGFCYTSQGQIIRPASVQETGARNGPGFAKTRRAEWYGALFEGTQDITVGTDFDSDHMHDANFETDGGTAYTETQLFSGMWRDTNNDNYSFDSLLGWQSTRMKPATVVAIGPFLEATDV